MLVSMKQKLLVVAALAVAALATIPAAAQQPPGTPVKSGRVTFTFGGKNLVFENVTGTFSQSYGFTLISLAYQKGAKGVENTHLNVSLMINAVGKVDLNQPFGNGIGIFSNGTIYTYQKGKATCTMTVSKLSPTAVEGVADCPLLAEVNGSGTSSLTGVTFSASTK